MKNLIASLSLVAALAIGSGCATSPNTDPTGRTQRVTESLAFTGTVLALAKHPEHRPAFESAAGALEALVADDQLTIADIYSALSVLPIDELRSTEAVLVIGNLQLILEEFDAGIVDLERLEHARAAGLGLSAGIRRALDS